MFRHYRQFEEMSEKEISADLRAKAAERRRQALARVEPIDLSATTWPEYPPSTVVNAITYPARRGLHRYRDATALRSELAHRHGVPVERLVVGGGAAQLLAAAAQALLEPLDELVTPWPSYPLFPLMAQRAGGRPVPVDLSGGRVDADAIVRAVGELTRVVIICNPNDPTGTYTTADELATLIGSLPEDVHVLLDEAYVEFQDVEDVDAVCSERHARGVALLNGPMDRAWGVRTAAFADPDGHVWEVAAKLVRS